MSYTLNCFVPSFESKLDSFRIVAPNCNPFFAKYFFHEDGARIKLELRSGDSIHYISDWITDKLIYEMHFAFQDKFYKELSSNSTVKLVMNQTAALLEFKFHKLQDKTIFYALNPITWREGNNNIASRSFSDVKAYAEDIIKLQIENDKLGRELEANYFPKAYNIKNMLIEAARIADENVYSGYSKTEVIEKIETVFTETLSVFIERDRKINDLHAKLIKDQEINVKYSQNMLKELASNLDYIKSSLCIVQGLQVSSLK